MSCQYTCQLEGRRGTDHPSPEPRHSPSGQHDQLVAPVWHTRDPGKQARPWKWIGLQGRPARPGHLQMRQQSLAGMALQEGWVVIRQQESRERRDWDLPRRQAGQRRFSAWNPVSRQQPGRRRCPIRTHIRRPKRPPLLYFAAVLTVRSVRISLLTSGTKRARTADLLHAIWRQHVHPRPSVQVTVPACPRQSPGIRTRCGTSCCTHLPTDSGPGHHGRHVLPPRRIAEL